VATKVTQIDPIDLRSATGVGINLPFSGQAVFNTTYTTKDAIKANLINYFLTDKRERVLNPTFGSGIRVLLFENITEELLLSLKARVLNEIKVYFPRIEVKDLKIQSSPDRNTINIYLSYSIINSNVDDEILINIEQ
jgi:phage baseplate assembly protein W